MSIDLCNHLGLRMTGITLSCLNISMVQFQLVGCTAMAQGMKDYIGQARRLFQSLKLVPNNPILAWAASFQCQD